MQLGRRSDLQLKCRAHEGHWPIQKAQEVNRCAIQGQTEVSMSLSMPMHSIT